MKQIMMRINSKLSWLSTNESSQTRLGDCTRAFRLPTQLEHGNCLLVHLVRTVGEPQATGTYPHTRERRILTDSHAAEGLYCLVDHTARHPRGHDFDHGNQVARNLSNHSISSNRSRQRRHSNKQMNGFETAEGLSPCCRGCPLRWRSAVSTV